MSTQTPPMPAQDICGVRIFPYLFNLVVYSPHPARTSFLKELLKNLVDNFPSRVLFIEALESQDSKEIVVQTGPGEENHVLACEVLIRAPMHLLSRVPFVLLPHLVPDLPVALLWDKDPTAEQDILPHLLKFSSRLIFDSESVENLPQFSQCISAQEHAAAIDLIDLNWARLRGWRDAFDEVFDSPIRINQLTLAKHIKICYDGHRDASFHNTQLEALYLQAWIATQLRWQTRRIETDGKSPRIVYFNGFNEVVVELNDVDTTSSQPGMILAVEITGDEYSYSMKQEPGKAQATIHISSLETCELPFSVQISGPRLRYQFLKDILYGTMSQHYLNMLHTLAQQDWKV